MSYFRVTGGLALCGLLGYAAADAVNDSVMYFLLRRTVAEKVLGHPTLEAELGPPLQLGSWASTSFGFSNGRRIANMCVPVMGRLRSCDVTTKVVRTESSRTSTLWYNVFGPAQWEIVVLNASLPSEGAAPNPMMPQSHGLLREVSLLDNPQPFGDAPPPVVGHQSQKPK